GEYIRLSDYVGSRQQPIKAKEAIENPNVTYRYTFNQKNFKEIPGSPIAYWASEDIMKSFVNGKRLDDIASPRQGLATADNNRFLRLWWEPVSDKIKLNAKSATEFEEEEKKWAPYNKGGSFRKWYGNNDYLINWENDGHEIRNFKNSQGKQRSVIRNPKYFFKESISWSKISSGSIAFRYKPWGHLFDVAGTSIYSNHEELQYL